MLAFVLTAYWMQVLTVAHRLHTIIDSDRVLVMHSGTYVTDMTRSCACFDEVHLLAGLQSLTHHTSC